MWDGKRSVQSRGRVRMDLVTSGCVVWRVSVPQLRLQHHCTPSPIPDSMDLAGVGAVHGLWGPRVGEEL